MPSSSEYVIRSSDAAVTGSNEKQEQMLAVSVNNIIVIHVDVIAG